MYIIKKIQRKYITIIVLITASLLILCVPALSSSDPFSSDKAKWNLVGNVVDFRIPSFALDVVPVKALSFER